MLPRIILVLALVLPVAPGGPAASAHGSNKRLDEIQSEIRQKRRQLRSVKARERSAVVTLRATDSKRDGLTRDISDLAAAIAAARDRMAELQAGIRAARSELTRWTRRLELTEAELTVEEAILADRAATAYKMGPSGYLDVILGSSSLRELTDRVQLVGDVLVADVAFVRSIQTTRNLVRDQRRQLAEQRSELVRKRKRQVRELEHIESLKAERERLRAQVERELEIHEALVHDIQTTRAEYEQAVAALEQESANVRAALQGGGSSGSGRIGGKLAWPTAGPVVSSFGWRTHPIFGTRRFHAGIDIDGSCGQAIVAGESGKVVSAGWRGGYGETTIVDHGDGLSTLYAHQSGYSVSSGQGVSRGQRIGSVGTTGWSTGCHLHFEVRVNGEPVNPMSYL